MIRVSVAARVGALAVAGLLSLGALTGCASAASKPSAGPTRAASHAMVIDQDFPDPDVVKSAGKYYLFATNTSSFNIQLATSSDLTHWHVTNVDALPTLPSWAQKGNTWAPDVSELSAGHFVMYFVAREPKSGKQCIGMATSDAPDHPFSSTETKPLLCDKAQGGDIDPATFADTDGTRYLVWKNDGNCCGLPTWLQIAPLSADGSALTGKPTKLIQQTLSWEGNLVEAPTLVLHDGKYVLFYSSNDYSNDKYAVGYATASRLLGPYKKDPQPFLSTTSSHGAYRGPGGQDVVAGPGGQDYLVFHSWDAAYIYRGVSILPLRWNGATPTLPR